MAQKPEEIPAFDLADKGEEAETASPLFAKLSPCRSVSENPEYSAEKTWFSPTPARTKSTCSETSALAAQTARARSKSSGDMGDTGKHNLANKIRKSTSAKLVKKPESNMDNSPRSQNMAKPSPFLNNALYASGGLYNSDKNSPVRRRSFKANQFQDPSANMPHGKSLSNLEEVQKESKELAAAGRPRGPSAVTISLSEAKQRLFNHTLSGVMLKRGFGGFRVWRWRHVVLCGRMLSYFTHHPENDPGQKQMPRGQLEIHKMTRVRMIDDHHRSLPPKALLPLTARSHDAKWFGFEVIPFKSQVAACKKGKWMLCVSSDEERRTWIDALVASIRLIERTEEPATLRGLGKVFDHFHVRGVLGKGRFGVVRLIHHRPTRQPFALKEIDKSRTDFKAARETIRNELKVLRRLKLRLGSHPYVCSTYEVYEDRTKIRIVMEFLGGGDLFDSITARGKYSEGSASAIIQQLIRAAHALHCTGIIHRDIKPENVLFTASDPCVGAADIAGDTVANESGAAVPTTTTITTTTTTTSSSSTTTNPVTAATTTQPGDEMSSPRASESVKIADFGCSLLLKREKGQWVSTPTAKQNQLMGTPGYIAPEVLRTCHYTTACDVFSIGVIMYIMLVGYPPFWGDDDDEVFDKTRRGDYYFYKADWEHISLHARNLCAAMLENDPANRITATMALRHPWIRSPPSNPIPSTKMRLTKLNELRKHKNDVLRQSLKAPEPVSSPTVTPSDSPIESCSGPVPIERKPSAKPATTPKVRYGSQSQPTRPQKFLPTQSPGIQRIGSTSYSGSTIDKLRSFSFPGTRKLKLSALDLNATPKPEGSRKPMLRLADLNCNAAPARTSSSAISHGTPDHLAGSDSLFG